MSATQLRAILAANLRHQRREKRWSQTTLAQAIDCDQSFISHIERGSRDITLATLAALAEALGVSAASLLETPPAAELTQEVFDALAAEGAALSRTARDDARHARGPKRP